MELVFEVHKMQGYEYFITIHFISLSILHLQKCCLYIYWLTVHQEYLILNGRYGLATPPSLMTWATFKSDDRCFRFCFLILFMPFFNTQIFDCQVTFLQEFHFLCHNCLDLQANNWLLQTFLLWTTTMYLHFPQRPIGPTLGWSKQLDLGCRSWQWKTHCPRAISFTLCASTNDLYESAGPAKDAAIITCFWIFF